MRLTEHPFIPDTVEPTIYNATPEEKGQVLIKIATRFGVPDGSPSPAQELVDALGIKVTRRA